MGQLASMERELEKLDDEINRLKRKRKSPADKCSMANRVTEIYKGIPLEIGTYFCYPVSSDCHRYTHYYTHKEDVELKPKNMRWVLELIDYPPADADGKSSRRIVRIFEDAGSKKNAIEMSKEWIVLGQEWLDRQ